MRRRCLAYILQAKSGGLTATPTSTHVRKQPGREGPCFEADAPLQSEFDVLRLLELHGEPHDALQELEPEESVLVVGVVLRFLGLVGGGLQLVDLLEQRPQVHDVALRRLGSLLERATTARRGELICSQSE